MRIIWCVLGLSCLGCGDPPPLPPERDAGIERPGGGCALGLATLPCTLGRPQ